MGKEMVALDRALLEQALQSLINSGGTRSGQMCHLEADEWHEVMSLIRMNLTGRSYYLNDPS